MDCLIYRYQSIYEPAVIKALSSFGLNCIEECSGFKENNSVRVDAVSKHIISHIKDNNPLLFVFSINFFPDISELCERLNTLYVCWSVDCPVLELFSETIKNKHNRIFLFDRGQYLRFHKYNPDCIFHLPLATNFDSFQNTINSISKEDRINFSSDISFVGSLYTEKNPMKDVTLSPKSQGFVDGLLASQLPLYGSFILEDALPNDIVDEIINFTVVDPISGFVEPVKKYMAANDYLGSQLTVNERQYLLSLLSENFDVSLYTLSDSSSLPLIHDCGPANSLTEMPKIFNLSKINLNFTMRPISTGLPLRIFDVLGCGGFLITNYQEELFDYFVPGEDLEIFTSADELIDKCKYYLSHEDERIRIAKSGYEKVKSHHTIDIRMAQLISNIVG